MNATPAPMTETDLARRLHSILTGLDLEDSAHLWAAAEINDAASFLSVGPGSDRAVTPSVDAAADTRRLLDDLEALPAETRGTAPIPAVLLQVRFAADRLGVR